MSIVALFGAGGNMGTRISNTLRGNTDYEVLCVEADSARHDSIRQRGFEPVASDDALARADILVLAIPDRLIGRVAQQVVTKLKSGAMTICLDPAAPYAGLLPNRGDISYFVTHPAHPPVFNDEQDPDARRDFFGSGKARQAIVNALMQGPESDYARGEAFAKSIWAPILRSHRVTVEQMAMLEPALSETVCATCLKVIRDAMDEAVRRGVPHEAARDFLLGHINVELAILFKEIDWDFSDGCKQAMAEAEKVLFQPDWKKVFDADNLRQSTHSIASE